MPSVYFSSPLVFLVDVLLGFYAGIIALRIIMQWAQWEYHNPLVQLIIRATRAPVKFLRHYLPSLNRWDSATIVLLVAIIVVKIILLSLLQSIPLNTIPLIHWMLSDIFSLFVTLFTASILIQIILSWLAPQHSANPITPLVNRMNAPLLRPINRWLPPMGGLDLSPLVVILGLHVLSMLVLPLLTGHY